MKEGDFWLALGSGKADKQGVVYSKEGDFGYFTLSFERDDVVMFMDLFGSDVVAGDDAQKNARHQLFEKLASGEYYADDTSIWVLLLDEVREGNLMEFASHPDDDTVFDVRFVA